LAKNIDKTTFPGFQGGPLMHVIAAKAVAFGEAMTEDFKAYAGQICKNAKALGESLQSEGLRLVSGGTDNHLLLVDLNPYNISGKKAEEALDRAGITVNKNMIPFDTRKPMQTSGIRIGTPALTTRGMREGEMKRVGQWIGQVLRSHEDEKLAARIAGEVREFASSFPLHVPVRRSEV
jgi:glycine hydroxymethyltransferase